MEGNQVTEISKAIWALVYSQYFFMIAHLAHAWILRKYGKS
jgi:hypothetical protein